MIRTVITKNQSTGVNVDEKPVSHHSSDEEEDENERSDSESENTEKDEEDKTGEYEESSDEEEEGEATETASEFSEEENKKGKRFHLIGECHIGLATILKNIMEFINDKKEDDFEVSGILTIGHKKNINAEINLNDISETTWTIKEHTIWLFGQKVGEIDIKIEAKNLPFIRQMPFGVLTGQGLRFASTPWPEGDFGKGGASRRDLPEELRDILYYLREFKKRDTTKNGDSRVGLFEIEKV